MIVSTEAVVLHSRKYGDSSRIVVLYTKDYGKISVLAKGARKPKNKFGSSLEPLSYSRVTIYMKSHRDLHLLSESELIIPMRQILATADSIAAGLSVLESVSQTQHEHESNEELFEELINYLMALNQATEKHFGIFVLFQLRLAEIIGFGFEFSSYIHEDMSVLSAEGLKGIINYKKESIQVEGHIIKILKGISEIPVYSSVDFSGDEKTRLAILDFFKRYFSYHLEKKIHYKAYNILNSHVF